MKKTILILTAVVAVVITSMVGCKKDFHQNEEINTVKQTEQHTSQAQRPSSNVSVNQYGFLVFSNVSAFEEYRNFVKRSTHGEIQEYLNSIEFTSLGASLYGEEYFSQTVTEEQSIDYIFNLDKLFQVEDVIMKPINETIAEVKWQFLLTMVTENLSNSSYEYLASGTYDGNTMNKFATNPENEDLNLFEFIKETPAGYAETTANSAQARRPMFGSVTTCTDSQCFNAQTAEYDPCSWVNTKSYFFWIKVSDGKGDQDGWKYGTCASNGY